MSQFPFPFFRNSSTTK